MPLVGIEHRVTVDIDLAGPDTATQRDTAVLMEIAEALGLPVEAVNQAGAFFLHKIPKWQDSLVLVHKGRSASFFRPDVNLFILLKLPRLSEADLKDTLAMLNLARKTAEPILRTRLKTALQKQLKSAADERLARLKTLLVTVATEP